MSGAEKDSKDPQGPLFSEPKSLRETVTLSSDLNSSSAGPDCSPFLPDHCDLLLDAMDAQLGQLQVQSHKSPTRFRDNHLKSEVCFRWSRSVSKDTGLGSTSQSNDSPVSCQGLIQAPQDHPPGDQEICADASEDDKQQVCKRSKDRLVLESHQEQVMWRLERLLGDACGKDKMSAQPLSDSICTEDFVRRFSEEMVDDGREQQINYPNTSEQVSQKAQREERKGRNDLSVLNEKRGAENSCSSTQKNTDICLGATAQHHSRPWEPATSTPKAKYLAGGPVWSFDTVSIDSDLDSVCTEEVQQHIHKQPGWRSLMESVRNLDELWKSPSEDRRVPSPSDSESCPENEQKHEAQRPRRHSTRPYGDDGINRLRTTSALGERLSSLQQKCRMEEATLNLKRSQVKEVERCLSELQQRKQNAVQEIERLTTDTAQLEQERRSLESVVSPTRAERDSVSCELEKLQRQKESCGQEARCTEDRRALRVCEKRSDVVVVSVLERDEMQRQLSSTKTELFAEQRRGREKVESLQERLEEAHGELQKTTERENSLKTKCVCLEDKHRQTKQQLRGLETQVRDLQEELQACRITLGTLEKILSQKELQLLDLQKGQVELETDRDELEGQVQQLKTQHYSALREVQEQARTEMETVLEQQKKDLDLAHETEIQKIKEEEANKLKTFVAQKNKEELDMAVLRRVRAAVAQERRKWEAEKDEAVQVECSRLEQQHRRREDHISSRIQREKSRVQALHSNVLQLQADKQRTAAELERALQCSENEANRLRSTLEERERGHSEATAEVEHSIRRWAQELQTESKRLQLLVEQDQSKHSSSLTVEEALTALRSTREQIRSFIGGLHQELQSQQRVIEQLRRDKERELSVQRQQLRMERDQALDSLKEHLIQDHIEELSSLNPASVCDGGGGSEELAECLRRQLKAKDSELRQVQRSMSQWKEQTAARMAWKFEEELTAELERNILKTQHELAPDEKAAPLSVLPSVLSLDCAASNSSSSASLKLLCYLQSRVKQLRLENQSLSPGRPAAAAGLSDSSEHGL